MEINTRAIPAVPNATADPLLRTGGSRPGHLKNGFLDAMTSQHPDTTITIDLTLVVDDRQPGGPHGRRLYIAGKTMVRLISSLVFSQWSPNPNR